MRRHRSPVVLAATVIFLGGCTVWHAGQRRPAAELEDPGAVTELPVQAYLANGDIIRFESGVRRVDERIEGEGVRYSAQLAVLGPVDSMPLDSLLGLEVVQPPRVNPGMTFLASVGGVALGAAATAGLLVALFGSCPTVYLPAPTPGDDPPVAELFSYSVAPLLEARDVDLYPGEPENGVLRMDLRNEALETHFINHLELLEIVHASSETVVASQEDMPLALSDWMDGVGFTDRAGRDATALLAAGEEGVYATPEAFVTGATESDLEDWIEVILPERPATDSVALSLRLRNSLLNSVFLYDFMLSGDDLRGIEWLGQSLNQVGTAATFGGWYQRRMGLHIDVMKDGAWRPVGRIPDTGPIAWKETAVMLPVPASEDRVRYRLRFVADQWRIDQVRVAASVRRPEARVHAVAAVEEADGAVREDMVAVLVDPDERYLETRPGTALWVDFQVGADPAAGERTFLLGAQGYYTEWIRPDWIRPGSGPPEGFTPGDAGLVQVLRRWHEVRPWFEARFHDSRLGTERSAER